MNITETAKKFQLTPETLRYYERIGLLPKIEKDAGGRRNYSERDLDWIRYVASLRRAGVSVEAIQSYVRLFHEGEKTREERKRILIEERDKLETRIREMRETLDYLDLKIKKYDGYIRDFEKDKLEK